MPTSISALDSTGTAQTIATIDALLAVEGAVSDAAWSGTGNSTAIAALKAIATNALSTADSPVEIHQPCSFISFTPTLYTAAAYSTNNVFFATAAIANVSRVTDLQALLQSLTIIDKKKSHTGLSLLFFQTNVTSGAVGSAEAISATDALSLLGRWSIGVGDWKDRANFSAATYSGATAPNIMVQPATGTTTIYIVGVVDSATATVFAAGDVAIKLGFVQR